MDTRFWRGSWVRDSNSLEGSICLSLASEERQIRVANMVNSDCT